MFANILGTALGLSPRERVDPMSYPPGHRARVRSRIVRSARTLFNRHGFSRVSIEDIMAEAGLTRGGFYAYFKSKGELFAEAITSAVRAPQPERNAVDTAQQVIEAYLSKDHFEDVDGGCPMVALSSDVSRGDPTVKRAFEAVFDGMVCLFEHSFKQENRADHDLAIALASICVGGMAVARSISNQELADSLRDAVAGVALRAGAWRRRRA